MKILITSPSLDTNKNVSGISTITNFICNSNIENEYLHFELGRKDNEKRNLFWLINILGIYLKWPYVILFSKINIIHFNLALSKYSILRDFPLIAIAHLFQKRMILHLHGGEFLMNKKIPFWMNFVLKFSFSRNTPIIVLSPLEKEILQQKFNCNKIIVLANCIELKEARQFTRLSADIETLRILFLGRISIDKGIEYILMALDSLKKKGVKFKFSLAGKGPAEKIIVQKFSNLLGNDFEFKGVVTGNEKTELLKKCNVFLLPSFYEGLPMALIESMSFGIVPITTNVGSIKFVINNGLNGIFVKSHSSDDIEIAIEKLSNDKVVFYELSKNAQQFILNNFDPESYISQLNKIYNYE